MSETWNIDEQSGDGRQWWTIVTENGEIVAQVVMRHDADRIIQAVNSRAGLEAENARLVEAGTNLYHAVMMAFDPVAVNSGFPVREVALEHAAAWEKLLEPLPPVTAPNPETPGQERFR